MGYTSTTILDDSVFVEIITIQSPADRTKRIQELRNQAKILGKTGDFEALLKANLAEEKKAIKIAAIPEKIVIPEDDFLQRALHTTRETRTFLSSESFIKWLFSNGIDYAKELYEQLEIVACSAGCRTDFNKAFNQKKSELLREKFKLLEPKTINVEAFIEYFYLSMPLYYTMDGTNGISKFNEIVMGYEKISHVPLIVTRRFRHVQTGLLTVELAYCEYSKPVICIAEMQTISCSQKIKMLSSEGTGITSENAKQLVVFLSEFISHNIDNLIPATSITEIGWHKTNIIPYNLKEILGNE